MSNKSTSKSWMLLLGGIFVAAGLVALLVPSPHAYAAGGVGSGGSGGGGAGGHQTSYGHGWAIYDTADAGPSGNMRDGSTWASAKSTCQSASASSIYAYIVYNSSNQAKVYDYQTSWENFSAHFATGTAVQGGGVAIATSTARNAFNNLDTYNVDTANYTFGTNVAWFCYNYKDWRLTGTTTVNDSSVTPGQRVRFSHTVTNAGPDIATYDWVIQSDFPSNNSYASTTVRGDNVTAGRGQSNPNARAYDYTIPSNATNGQRYCMLIRYQFATGPNTATANGQPICATVTVSARPTGSITITCSADGRTATGVGNFSDADGSASYPLRGTLTSGISTATRTVNATSGSVTVSNAAVPMTGTISFTLNVPDVGPAASAANNFSTTVNRYCPPPPPPGTPCPEPPPPSNETRPTVNIPDTPMPRAGSSGASAPSGRPSGPGEVYYREVAGRIRVDSAADQYSQTITWTPTGFSSNPFTFDYKNYVDSYPYDSHDTTVGYTQQWQETRYRSVFDTSCPSGGTYSNGQCRYAASFYYSCPSGQYVRGADCYRSSNNTRVGPATRNYYCSGPGTVSGNTCSYTIYRWQLDSGPTTVTSSSTYAAPALGQCYYRGVTIQPEPSTRVDNTNVPDVEDPTSVTYQAIGAVIFNRDPSAPATANNTPRNTNQVTMTYTRHAYYSSDPNATSGTALPNCPDASGSITLSTSSFGTTVSQSTGGSTCNASPSYSPPMQVGDYFCVSYTFTLAGSKVNQSGGFTNSNATSYTVSSCQSPITNQPYVHVFGADVAAGGKFASATGDCSAAPTVSAIRAFIKGSAAIAPLTRGSATQFGALALGPVNGFGSASLRTNDPVSTYGLTFANRPAGTYGSLGTSPCVHNYFANKPAGVSTTGPIVTSGTRSYSFTGNTTIGNLNLPSGANLAIYVLGDLTIDGNITLATNSPDDQQVPTFYVIVSGNINVEPGVTQLDGVYIAQRNGGSGGAIDTCSIIVGDDRYTMCNQQLTINGAFIAQNVRLNRTFASIRNSVGGEVPGPLGDCTTNGNGVAPRNFDCAAEIFNFTPEVFLGSPAIPAKVGASTGKFDYITSLSPVL